MQTGRGATNTIATFKYIRQRRRRLFGAPTASKNQNKSPTKPTTPKLIYTYSATQEIDVFFATSNSETLEHSEELSSSSFLSISLCRRTTQL